MEPNTKPDEIATKPEWIAPQLVVLSIGATAGGPNFNTEAFNYHPAGS